MNRSLVAPIAILAATPAFAGGLSDAVVIPAPVVAVAPAAPAAHDWSGFYFGAQVGRLDAQIANDSLEGDGTTYGLHAGYRFGIGNAVLGVEGEVDFADIGLTVTDTGADTGVAIDRVVRIKGQLGYALGNFLPYVTAGYADGNANGTDLVGTAYGIGRAYAFSPNLSVGLEALKHDLEDEAEVGTDATSVSLRASYSF